MTRWTDRDGFIDAVGNTIGLVSKAAGLSRVWECCARKQNCVVLVYHRICSGSEFSGYDEGYAIAPERFARQMEWIRKRYTPISLEDLNEALTTARPLSRKAVHITFDDGYCDIQRYAVEILSSFRVPATVFVMTAFADGPRNIWWDDLAASIKTARVPVADLNTALGHLTLDTTNYQRRRETYLQIRRLLAMAPHGEQQESLALIRRALSSDEVQPHHLFMDWSTLRDVERAGVRVESHGLAHARYAGLSDAELGEEAAGSKASLEREMLRQSLAIAFPYGTRGMYDSRAGRAAQEAGYQMAFSGRSGQLTQASARFDLPRVPVRAIDSQAAFESKVSGVFGTLYQLGQRATRMLRAS